MKKLLKNVFYVAIFVVSGIVFQISCSNSVDSTTDLVTNKLVFYRGNSGGTGFWICDEDGSNQTPIPVVIPSSLRATMTSTNVTPHLSADGQKLFFFAADNTDLSQNIYSCNIDGSNLQQIVTSGSNGILSFGK